jgi:hypothetical protein
MARRSALVKGAFLGGITKLAGFSLVFFTDDAAAAAAEGWLLALACCCWAWGETNSFLEASSSGAFMIGVFYDVIKMDDGQTEIQKHKNTREGRHHQPS